MSEPSVAIVGAGIAGLTTALCLSRFGISSTIVEQASHLGEVGAGLQLSPNATAILSWIGLTPALATHWYEPEAVRLVSGLSLKTLTSIPVRDLAASRWRGHYGVIHRAALQQVLLKAVNDDPNIALHLGHRLDRASLTEIAALTGRQPDVIIGADGVWSRQRGSIEGTSPARFSGNIAWRFVVPWESVPEVFDRQTVTAFLAPSSHMVCYPLGPRYGFNVVAIASGLGDDSGWQERKITSAGHLQLQFSDWHEEIRRFLRHRSEAAYWPLFEVPDGAWHNGHTTALVGDAAHAMMPFAAQGAAMAIEDAFELAACLSSEPVAEALAIYEAVRRPRINVLRQRGAFNKFVYHARGPVRLARDLFLSLQSPASLASSLDTIYAYRSSRLPD